MSKDVIVVETKVKGTHFSKGEGILIRKEKCLQYNSINFPEMVCILDCHNDIVKCQLKFKGHFHIV